MYLKKKLFAVAAVVAMTAAVVFGSRMEPGAVESLDEQLSRLGQKETIYCWYSDENMSNYINMAAVSFGERENVRVIPVLTSDNAYLEAINQASMTEDEVPDVYIVSNDSLEKAYLSGLATQVQDPDGICNEQNFHRAALDAVSYHGKQVAYPLYYDTSVLVYNKTYLHEWVQQQANKALTAEPEEEEDAEVIPETATEEIDPEVLLEQYIKEYELLSKPDTVDAILNIANSYDPPETVEGIMAWDVSDIYYNYWAVGNYMIVGGDTGDDESNIDINNDKVRKCMEEYEALTQFFDIAADTVSYEAVVQDFLEGKTMFSIATTDIVEAIRVAEQEGTYGYDYVVAVMPDVSGDLQSRSLSITGTAVVNGYSAKKELANRFASYLAGEFAGEIYERTGKPSANLHANADNEMLQICMEEYAGSISIPKMMATGNFWMQAEILFSKVWNGGDIPTLIQELDTQIYYQMQQ